jgi:RimJ/RimL family protein N-acetyltransferase
MPYVYWPLFDLRLHIRDLTLRSMTEADLASLAELKPFDVEQDPALPDYAVADLRTGRGIRVHQSYWRSLGTWRPGTWNLGFVVLRGDRLLGVQDLEARDFGVLKTVETSSWLRAEERGQGVGKAMRLAVLTLAFEGLGATVAETEAWHDNAASIGVSRALGYQDNGIARHARAGGADDMVRLRLTRERWRELHREDQARIEHLAPCLPMFGST